MLRSKIRKAVIPAAGHGTRFLPVTKVVPKEMLPIAGKPLIQFAVEEAAASGLETVILVLGRGKRLLADYFQENPRLEEFLAKRGRIQEVEELRRLSRLIEIRTVWQDSALGLAHAIGCAQSQIEDEAFAVILPDALIDSAVPCVRQLMDCYDRHPGCIVATRQVDDSEVERFGILEGVPVSDPRGRVLGVHSLIERPDPRRVASRHGIFGRYILNPQIFECIDQLKPGFGGELQLTDALMGCSHSTPVYGYCFEGTHYDAGDKTGFLEATLHFALRDPVLSGRLSRNLPPLDTPALAVRS